MPACSYCKGRGYVRIRRRDYPVFQLAVRRCACIGGMQFKDGASPARGGSPLREVLNDGKGEAR